MNAAVKIFPWVKTPTAGAVPVLPEINGIVQPTGEMNVFTAEECARIIEIGRKVPGQDAPTSNGGDQIVYHHRNTRVRTIYPGESEIDWIFDKLEGVVTRLRPHFQFDMTGFYEGGQIYHYPTGGFLDWHMDIGLGYMSRRKLAISVQLSDGDSYEGGDLEFEDATRPAPRKAGTVIVFPAFMRHRVTPITLGVRDCFVSWVHGPPFR